MTAPLARHHATALGSTRGSRLGAIRLNGDMTIGSPHARHVVL